MSPRLPGLLDWESRQGLGSLRGLLCFRSSLHPTMYGRPLMEASRSVGSCFQADLDPPGPNCIYSLRVAHGWAVCVGMCLCVCLCVGLILTC